MTKVAFWEACRGLGVSKAKIWKLFNIGAGRYWNIIHDKEKKNSQIFTPCQLSSFPTLNRDEKLKNSPFTYSDNGESHRDNKQEPIKNTESSSLPDGSWKTGRQGNQDEVIKLDDFEVVE